MSVAPVQDVFPFMVATNLNPNPLFFRPVPFEPYRNEK